MLKKINHLGIAVKDLDSAVNTLKLRIKLEVSGIEEVPSQKVRVAFLPVGESRLAS